MNIRKTYRVLAALSKAEIQEAMAYRLGGLAWVINGSISSLLMMYIWTLVVPNHSQVISYFLGVVLMNRLTGSWSFYYIADGIKEGTLSKTLLKPYHYLLETLSHDIGQKLNRLLSMVPYIVILGFIFSSNLSVPSGVKVILCIPAIICGYFINFVLGTVLGLLTNWTGDADGINRLFDLVSNLASGFIIPYFFMPESLRNILIYLPFRYIVSFPLEIMLNQLNNKQTTTGYLILFCWMAVLTVIYRYLDRQSMKSFTAHGN